MCSPPVNLTNGEVSYAGLSEGDTATYSCNAGFELIGEATIICVVTDNNTATFIPPPTSQSCLRK